MRSIRSCIAWVLAAWTGMAPTTAGSQEQLPVEDGKRIAIQYTLKLDDGTVASSNVGKDPLSYVQGSGDLLPALQAALVGMKRGESRAVSLPPAQAYGFVDSSALVEVPAAMIPEQARIVGARLVGKDERGKETMVRVHEVRPDRIVLDHNHPLAGETLHFDVKVLSVE